MFQIDVPAVGFSLALVDVIVLGAALLIGGVTAVLSLVGLLLVSQLVMHFGKLMEFGWNYPDRCRCASANSTHKWIGYAGIVQPSFIARDPSHRLNHHWIALNPRAESGQLTIDGPIVDSIV